MKEDISAANFIALSEINDSNVYDVQCPKGHESHVVLQQQKFELLFDVGACALLDGYYREAVTSFTSSLERFYEFFIRAALVQNEVATADIETIWSHLGKQSERQLGAYIAVFTRECGTTPTLLSRKNVEFRNDVIHRGRIRSRSEAVVYGEAVLSAVRPALSVAKERLPKGVEQLVAQHLIVARKSVKSTSSVATSCMPTILSLSRGEATVADESLEAALTSLYMWNWRLLVPGI
jgi:hypothetical protein